MGYVAKNLTKEVEFNILEGLECKGIVAYCDGSFQNSSNNGYGVVITDTTGNKVYEEQNKVAFVDAEQSNMTNVKAELAAVVRAVEKVSELGATEVTIVYDCNAVIDMLVCSKVKSNFSLKYREVIKNCSNNFRLNFRKKNSKDLNHKVAHNLARFYISDNITC